MVITTETNDIKERLSVAYVTAIAARAGCQVTKLDIDKQSIDATIRPISGKKVSVDLQLKATSSNCFDGEELFFDLPLNNYDDLRDTECTSPHYLVILALDEEDEFWLIHEEDCLILSKCAYWVDLRGMPPSSNSTTQRVRFSRSQTFDVTALVRMLNSAYTATSYRTGA